MSKTDQTVGRGTATPARCPALSTLGPARPRSLLACHGALRAGDRLTPEEIAGLVVQRDLVRDTHHCPHGRPTALLFSHRDLERQFRRN
jgi:hypothetical protein